MSALVISILGGCLGGLFIYEAIKSKEHDRFLLSSLAFISIVLACLAGCLL